MSELWSKIIEFVTGEGARAGLRAAVALAVGLVVMFILRRSLRSAKRLHPQHIFLLRRGLSYLVVIVAVTLLAAVICTFLPAQRASRTNPAEAVRWME